MSNDWSDIKILQTAKQDDWVATCGLCDANFAITAADSPENPGPHGTFCPDCRAIKHIAPGVLNWRRRTELIGESDKFTEGSLQKMQIARREIEEGEAR